MQNRLDRYRIDEQISSGGLGTVFRGLDQNLNRPVAIKKINLSVVPEPLLVGLVQQDIYNLSRITHANLLKIFDFFIDEPNRQAIIVMELIEGLDAKPLTLADRSEPLIDRIYQLPRRAAEITAAIARALQVLHDNGITHFDIKPSNILVTASGEPMIADFGSTILLGGPQQADFDVSQSQMAHTFARLPDLNLTGEVGLSPHNVSGLHLPTVGGTPNYMSPEQWIGSEVTHLSDQYSLGIMLYELLSGNTPFTERNLDQLGRAHMDMPLPILDPSPLVPTALEAVIIRSTDKDPNERYASMDMLADAIESALDQNTNLESIPSDPSDRIHSISYSMSQLAFPEPSDNQQEDDVVSDAPIFFETIGDSLHRERIVGNFKFDVHLSKGGFGNLFIGQQMRPHLDGTKSFMRDVAIKTITPRSNAVMEGDYDELLDSYYKDLVAMEVNHPNVVTVYDTGIEGTLDVGESLRASINCSSNMEEEDFRTHPLDECSTDIDLSAPLVWIAYELANGTLQSVIDNEKFEYANSDIFNLITQMTTGVGFLHKKGIVHRDIKPSNLLYFRESKVWKVGDLGASGNVNNQGYAGTHSMFYPVTSGEWSAPEQRLGYPVTFAADIWSIGQIMFYLFAQERALERWPGEPSPPISELNPNVSNELWDIVLKCTEFDPKNRYTDASELLTALGTI